MAITAHPMSPGRHRACRSSAVPVAFAGVATIAALLAGGLVWQASSAGLRATTSNGGNAWQAGQVGLTAGSSSALFSLSGATLKPGDTGMQCITITYTGNVLGTVKLYESAQSGTLAPYVLMTVTRANGSGAADCSDFASLTGASGLTSGTDLVTFNSSAGSYATGLGAWTASTTTTKTYQFAYAVSNSAPNSVQNSTASATYTWEVQT